MAEAKDLLRGLSGDFGAVAAVFPAAAEDKPGEIELTLGLSIGGSFGGESKKGSLHRSSSISFLPSLQQRGKEESIAVTALARTSSLPVETEEEQRKRKELQYLRRMEAKRKRSEKRNCSRPSGRNRSAGREELQQAGGNKVRVSPESENPAASALGPGEGAGASSGGESAPARSPSPEKTETEVRGMMEEMPCVFTVGGEGKRVEGFLYRYRKGEEVRIVCVCHGRFFSPAEFVEHAGGGVVTHPLRHIVVNPSPAGFC